MPHRNNCAHERRNVIGKKLRSLRAAKGLSTQKLSEVLMELTGVYIDTSSLSRLEKGKRVVSDYELVALAHAPYAPSLKVTIDNNQPITVAYSGT